MLTPVLEGASLDVSAATTNSQIHVASSVAPINDVRLPNDASKTLVEDERPFNAGSETLVEVPVVASSDPRVETTPSTQVTTPISSDSFVEVPIVTSPAAPQQSIAPQQSTSPHQHISPQQIILQVPAQVVMPFDHVTCSSSPPTNIVTGGPSTIVTQHNNHSMVTRQMCSQYALAHEVDFVLSQPIVCKPEKFHDQMSMI
ncbi:hypothetical protein V6N13_106984 [Hibiscus sabdariffa]